MSRLFSVRVPVVAPVVEVVVTGKRAAAIMSLLATAKDNGIEPHAWLTDVLTRLPTTLDRDIGDLLPHTWKARRG